MTNREEILKLKDHPMSKEYTKRATEFLKKALDQLPLYEYDGIEGVKDEEGREVHHVVMVFEDLNDPEFSDWALKVSKRTIEEHRELENSGVMIVSFMGDELVGTRVIDIDEALRLIS